MEGGGGGADGGSSVEAETSTYDDTKEEVWWCDIPATSDRVRGERDEADGLQLHQTPVMPDRVLACTCIFFLGMSRTLVVSDRIH